MNYEERLNALKKQIQEANIQQVRLQHELETAHNSMSMWAEKLNESFGVKTVTEAKDLLTKLNTELSQILTEAESQLEKLRDDS